MRKKLTHNLGLKLASLVLAFVLWFLVVQINDPKDTERFTNVQVKLINTELLEKEGKVYEVLDNTDKVSVTVSAPRSIIDQMRASDIVAEADVSRLTDINTIVITYDTPNVEVNSIEGDHDVVRLSVENKKSKWIKLVSNTVGDVADGYIVSNVSLDQTNIEISGPESLVSAVDHAAVDISVAGATTSLSANVDIQLGLMVKDDLGSVIAETKTLNQVVTHCDKTHFDIIAGRSGSAGLASMPIGRLQILGEDLSLLANAYNKVILDMGAGVEKSVRILSSLASEIIVVCTDEPTSLTDAYAFIKIMSMQYPKCRLNIVVNQANSVREGERTYETMLKACRNFLKISPPLLGVVRRDTRVRDAIRSQMPLISRYPTSEAAEDVIAIARKLISEA